MPEKCVDCFDSSAGGPRYGSDRCKECMREMKRQAEVQESMHRPEHIEKPVTRTPGARSTMIFYHGRKVGTVSGNTFTTYRKRDIHFARKHGGWGMNTEVFKTLKDGQVGEVLLIADGTPYRVSLADWDRYGVVDTLNADDGEQVFLSEGHFRAQ